MHEFSVFLLNKYGYSLLRFTVEFEMGIEIKKTAACLVYFYIDTSFIHVGLLGCRHGSSFDFFSISRFNDLVFVLLYNRLR